MTFFDDVRVFHDKFDLPRASKPRKMSPAEETLRFQMIAEEMTEMMVAHEAGDVIALADAIADVVYVVLGFAVELGLPFNQIWNEVHRTNMMKSKTNKRADGKLMKPEGWEPPALGPIIEEASK
jgi:predicted HAD superfamily Cof-like phosphohydrolase